MKQHITVEQLDELTAEQTVTLFNWGMTKGYLNKDEVFLPSIGQMIEFLGNDWATTFIVPITKYWDDGAKFDITNDNLCDVLWQAVKEVLEKED